VRITRLVLRDFRRYRELEIPLAPGLTIVHGPNEAGKTTIQRAIELALTRKVTSGGADMDARLDKAEAQLRAVRVGARAAFRWLQHRSAATPASA